MDSARTTAAAPTGRGALPTLGFGTTVAMWGVGYVTHLPGVEAPGVVVAPLLGLAMLAGGVAAGRFWDRGWRGGVQAGLLTALLNMLILGSLLASTEGPGRVVPSALLWIPGSLVFSAVLGAVGALLGQRLRPTSAEAPSVNWSAAFAGVAAAATLMLLAVGGLVTSHGAGLAVVDWPNSFGYNMFLYPLSRMTGGIYYEHAHRLFGSLVGLTTFALMVHLLRHEARRWIRRLAVFAFVFVCAQGLLGGLRVTGRLTLATDPSLTSPNLLLAVVHGVTGQLFFALIVFLGVALTRAWTRFAPEDPQGAVARSGGLDRGLGVTLLVALVLQLILGAVLRHTGAGLLVHISAAALVLMIALLAGVRAWGMPGRPSILKRLGTALMIVVSLQVALGFGALIAVGANPGAESAGIVRAWLATPHQVTGALLLAVATALAAWNLHALQPAAARHAAGAEVAGGARQTA